jgi:hypothetical protein
MNFIDVNNRGLVIICHFKQHLNNLFCLSHVLADESTGTEIEKSAFAFFGDRFGQHCFSVARRSVEQDAFGRSPDSFENIGAQIWQNQTFPKLDFRGFQSGNLREGKLQVVFYNVLFYQFYKRVVRVLNIYNKFASREARIYVHCSA